MSSTRSKARKKKLGRVHKVSKDSNVKDGSETSIRNSLDSHKAPSISTAAPVGLTKLSLKPAKLGDSKEDPNAASNLRSFNFDKYK